MAGRATKAERATKVEPQAQRKGEPVPGKRAHLRDGRAQTLRVARMGLAPAHPVPEARRKRLRAPAPNRKRRRAREVLLKRLAAPLELQVREI